MKEQCCVSPFLLTLPPVSSINRTPPCTSIPDVSHLFVINRIHYSDVFFCCTSMGLPRSLDMFCMRVSQQFLKSTKWAALTDSWKGSESVFVAYWCPLLLPCVVFWTKLMSSMGYNVSNCHMLILVLTGIHPGGAVLLGLLLNLWLDFLLLVDFLTCFCWQCLTQQHLKEYQFVKRSILHICCSRPNKTRSPSRDNHRIRNGIAGRVLISHRNGL